MSTTFSVLYLGTAAALDPTEGNVTVENAATIVGVTYGSAGSPLYNNTHTFSPGSYAGGDGTAYDLNNSVANDTFRIDGGALQTFDSLSVYNATITYANGTTATITAAVMQDTAGRLYLVPETTYNADQIALEAMPITSLRLDSIDMASANMAADRYAADFVAHVDGTTGADSMGLGYTDPQGDQISTGADYIEAGAGDDTVVGSAGNDTIFGGDGNDVLGDWSLETGNDLIYGGTGNDSIIGGAGNDTVYGEAGDDTLSGAAGDDVLDGGDGSDAFAISDDHDGDTIIGGSGGSNVDLVAFWDVASTAGVSVAFSGDGAGTYAFDGTAGHGTFTGIEAIYGTQHGDFIDASATTAGIDIGSGAGDDSILGGSGNDTLMGYADNDTIRGGGGADYLDGGDGNDSLAGDLGMDTLYAGAGNDTLDGGGSDDVLSGGTGDDRITGGTGNDTFIYIVGDGNDTITDFNSGNTGTLSDGLSANNDFIDLSGYYDNLQELYADQADDGILNQSNTLDGAGRTIDYSNNLQFGAGGLTFTGATADAAFFTAENTGVFCFGEGTLILTPLGPRPIEQLRLGDRVTTLDNGPQPIRWIGRRVVGAGEMQADARLIPVQIGAGVLGNARPLLVSQQHGMLIGGARLIRARELVGVLGGGGWHTASGSFATST